MFQLEIKLKQHTPLIHFQHDQEGATLRASEVKPRLDKYILSKLSSEDKETGMRDGWIKEKGDKTWLDYKMRIVGCKKMIDSSMENDKGRTCFPSYFANQNATPEKIKKIVFPLKSKGNAETEKEDIIITIFLRDKFLKGKIDALKDSFFLTYNFGARHTKGFGSFFSSENTICSLDDDRIKDFFRFQVSIPIENQNWKKVYQKLDENLSYFYKTLRSGINIEPFYFKSLMFFYAKERKEYYDKRRIREYFKLFTDERTKRPTMIMMHDKGEKYEIDFPYNASNARLYRDMLGLSSSQSWQKYNAVISKENKDIERLESPLLLKPFVAKETGENVVFIVLLVPYAIPENYFDQTFTIKKNGDDSDALPLKTPSKEKFNLVEFLRYSLCKDEDGYKEALRQLQQNNYEQWKEDYISNCNNYNFCKNKLEKKHNRNNFSESEILKELEKEANRKIYKSNEIAKVIKNIYDSICCPSVSKANMV